MASWSELNHRVETSHPDNISIPEISKVDPRLFLQPAWYNYLPSMDEYNPGKYIPGFQRAIVDNRYIDYPHFDSVYKIRAIGVLDRGMRKEQQDSICLREIIVEDKEGIQRNEIIALVADGLSMGPDGKIASYFAKEYMPQFYQSLRTYGIEPEEALSQAMLLTHEMVRDLAPEIGMERSTTCCTAAVLQQDGTYYIAHVGDSRTYIIGEENWIRQVTDDQSTLAKKINNGKPDIRIFYDNPDISSITQRLGDDEIPKIATAKGKLLKGQRLLLCSDGLWGGSVFRLPDGSFIGGDAMLGFFATSHFNPEIGKAARKLLRFAKQNGARNKECDNIGFVLLELKDETKETKVDFDSIDPYGDNALIKFREMIENVTSKIGMYNKQSLHLLIDRVLEYGLDESVPEELGFREKLSKILKAIATPHKGVPVLLANAKKELIIGEITEYDNKDKTVQVLLETKVGEFDTQMHSVKDIHVISPVLADMLALKTRDVVLIKKILKEVIDIRGGLFISNDYCGPGAAYHSFLQFMDELTPIILERIIYGRYYPELMFPTETEKKLTSQLQPFLMEVLYAFIDMQVGHFRMDDEMPSDVTAELDSQTGELLEQKTRVDFRHSERKTAEQIARSAVPRI